MAWFSSSLGPDSCPHYVLNGCHLALNQFLTGPWHWSSTQRHSGSHYGLTPFPLFSFLFFKFIYFNWRLVTLQYCSGFAIHWHESAMGVHVFPILNPLPPPSPSHPSGSSQCTSPEDPVSCIEHELAIRFTYDNIHVSVLFSPIIPPSPSPTESKRLFYTSVSLLPFKLCDKFRKTSLFWVETTLRQNLTPIH